ncbi:hypothetical protein TNIN_328111 [Trichonephila inaurata madagascariensis]|uniref:Uncharacterized protein n=1 Tax=Trichonephila inaurata madagascariensis TaxID=2747483 RepID=A0A8X6MAV0_9ARAC|nr:hypothetical protein TNIN_328111 [Trichonephila inaurata madagascariensis]
MTLPTSTNSEQVAESLLPSVNLPGDLPPYTAYLLFCILSTTAQKSTQNLRGAVPGVHQQPNLFSMLFEKLTYLKVTVLIIAHPPASPSTEPEPNEPENSLILIGEHPMPLRQPPIPD